MQIQKIKVDQFRLGDIVQDIERGNLRIPSFQREFVWERTRIQKLLDSMYNEYPIGTLFLWEAPPEYNHLMREVQYLDQPALLSNRSYTLILDGQQRLTSLYAVVKGLSIEGEDYGKIVVDLNNLESESNSDKAFQYRTPDNSRWIAIRDLLSSDSSVYFPIYNQLADDKYRRKFEHCRSRLSNYPFSVVIVRGMDIQDAVEIFERINQQGRRLSRYDLIAATVLTDTFDLRQRTEADIVSKLNKSFGEIEETSIPQALALNIRGNTEYATQMSLTKEEVSNYWSDTVDCFLLAVDFVRHNLGVARVDFLPYDAMLPVLGYYFYQLRKTQGKKAVLSSEHRQQLERWFWCVAFSERYSSSSQTRMSEDAVWIRDLISDNAYTYNCSISTDVDTLVGGLMTYSSSAVRNGILCLLNLKQPLDFRSASRVEVSGEHFSNFTRPERHHIFPVAFLERQGWLKEDKKAVHRIPNFCFIPAELNLWISDKAPSKYLHQLEENYNDFYEFEKVMRSHLIPVDPDSAIWEDDYELFLKQRSRLLVDEIKHRCGISKRVVEEQRNPVLDAIEIGLRDAIHEVLSNAHGFGYWRQTISNEVHKNVMDRIEEEINKTKASKTKFQDGRVRLDFCDVSDYPKIILNNQNWHLFESIFGSKPECERALRDLKDFRNATKHVREVDTLKELRGQAAIIWLSRVLDVDLTKYGIF